MAPSRAAVTIVVALAPVGATACAGDPPAAPAGRAAVERVADGDSLVLEDGSRVRLLQIDAPELGEGECHGRESLRSLEELVEPGDEVTLARDPRLDPVDRHRRLLRYVHSGRRNLNVELVRRGAAAPYFLRGERGRHAEALLEAVEEARTRRRGLWGRCRVAWEPHRQIETRYP